MSASNPGILEAPAGQRRRKREASKVKNHVKSNCRIKPHTLIRCFLMMVLCVS